MLSWVDKDSQLRAHTVDFRMHFGMARPLESSSILACSSAQVCMGCSSGPPFHGDLEQRR